NDAVAMTGGQPVDGPVSVQGIAWSARAEGIERVALVSDDIAKFSHGDFPPGTTFRDRAELDLVQRELREIPGVTLLIYEQTCATEKRRRRKRGTLQEPDKFAFINELVCEGCGDCSVESNCLSVEPVETEFGRKRKINQSACNKDFSCVNGFCPSFVTVTGAKRRRKQAAEIDLAGKLAGLPTPAVPSLAEPFDLLVTGVGGTGVVTVGALITMAAHLEGMGASVLDFTGFAQKFGTVLSYIRLGSSPDVLNQARIGTGAADAVIGCDVVVSSAPKASVHYRAGTRMVLNTAAMPTGDLVLNRDADLKIGRREHVIRAVVGTENLSALNANALAERLMGDAVFANVMMLGFAWQQGLVPVSERALQQAILLNGVAVEKNIRAFGIGRVLAHDGAAFASPKTPEPEGLEAVIARRVAFLSDYQDAEYGAQFEACIRALAVVVPETLGIQAAHSLFRLMAIKDEFEVARLYTQSRFEGRLNSEFEGDFKVTYHMAPPILPLGKDARGRARKLRLGPWMQPVLRGLAGMRRVRGGLLDPFRFGADRKLDRDLLAWFETVLDRVGACYSPDNQEVCAALLKAPQDIRGYGPVRDASAETVLREAKTWMDDLTTRGDAR
ncbi:DUF6537 domain-containing protein, partial [Roseobacter sp.]|uniref:DUF6537 domain-containing protein n=1 Tax=Roseobacter sp. TaxID=1907202 RepID=UPI003296C473